MSDVGQTYFHSAWSAIKRRIFNFYPIHSSLVDWASVSTVVPRSNRIRHRILYEIVEVINETFTGAEFRIYIFEILD